MMNQLPTQAHGPRSVLPVFCGFNYLLSLLISTQVIATLYPLSVPFASTGGYVLAYVFILLSFLGHMGLLIVLCLWLPSYLLLRFIPLPRLMTFTVISLATFALLFLIVDIKLYTQFRFHLNTTLLSFIFSSEIQQVFGFSSHEWGVVFLFVPVLFILELLLWRTASRAPVIWRHSFHIAAVGACICLLLSYVMYVQSAARGKNELVQQTWAIPLYNTVLSHTLLTFASTADLEKLGYHYFTQPKQIRRPLDYPKQPLHCNPTSRPNFLLILIDSWRPDTLTPQLMPTLSRFANTTTWYQDHWSGGNSTQYGVFSLFYGLPSQYWDSMLEQQRRPVLFSTLKDQGYAINVFSSSEMTIPAFDKTVFLGVDQLVSHQQQGRVTASDAAVTTDFIQQLNKAASKQPFFTVLYYNAPHAYCTDDTFIKPFQPAVNPCQRLSLNQDSDPRPYLNRYRNSVHWLDQQLNQVITTLQTHHLLENTVVIITGDHGQEFNDSHTNAWEHASNYTAFQVKTPLLIHAPATAASRVATQTTHYDIVPTLLTRYLGCRNPASDYSLGKLLGMPPTTPYIIAGSYINFGIIEKDRINTVTPSGNILITNPGNQRLPGATPRPVILRQVLQDIEQFYRD